ncbi:hypothetical protein OIU78_029984 [Salix suchowensis]|nr:hypothetical protein OIU78_029984 [Salix suchowensis]
MDSSTTATISSLKTTISPSPNPNRAKKIPIFPYKKTKLPSFSNFKSVKCIHSPLPNPKPSNSSPFTCTAVTFSPSQTTELVPSKLHHLITEFQSLSQPIDRVKRLLHCATFLSPLPESSRVDSNRVMGCTAQVWLEAQLDQYGKMKFWADSDSEITRGFCYCLIWVLDGATPDEVLKVTTEDLTALNVGLPVGARSRVNTWHNVLVSMQKRARILVAERDGKKDFDPFPSLVISSDGIQAKGSYAEAQARYLFPDESKVQELVKELKEKKIGVVAHFYMDPEVQENVRAILDQAGFGEVGVYRMSNERIGCSLAEAASTPAYMNYLGAASGSPPSLHVIYINTSLETKAYAHELVPTITCTSSNVVQTILQAFAQIPDLNVWYGPDSYMGANISKLFQQMTMMSDEEIAEIHPAHNGDSIRSLLPRLHYYQDGTCIVHHLFGHEVVEKINEMYCDAFLTAHLEVPGEMFSLAMEAKRRGMGVVGSTQNILDFIKQRVQEALDRDVNDHLRFVLGTESGMVTSIVAAVRHLLLSTKSSEKAKVNVEIVFPVSADSITRTSTASTSGLNSVKVGDIILPVIPGAASGEGCSIHGGCASCPYMKMNSLDSLLKVCHHLPDEKNKVAAYEAERFKMQTLNGKSIADVGCEPILHMRHFQATKELPDKLVCQALSPNSNGRLIS